MAVSKPDQGNAVVYQLVANLTDLIIEYQHVREDAMFALMDGWLQKGNGDINRRLESVDHSIQYLINAIDALADSNKKVQAELYDRVQKEIADRKKKSSGRQSAANRGRK